MLVTLPHHVTDGVLGAGRYAIVHVVDPYGARPVADGISIYRLSDGSRAFLALPPQLVPGERRLLWITEREIAFGAPGGRTVVRVELDSIPPG